MSEFNCKPAAERIADWIAGAPQDSIKIRRARLLACHRLGRHPYTLGRLLTHIGFELLEQGRPTFAPGDVRVLISRRYRAWENRFLLGHHVLDALTARGIQFAQPAADWDMAWQESQEDARDLVKAMAMAHDDAELDAAWDASPQAGQDDFDYGAA